MIRRTKQTLSALALIMGIGCSNQADALLAGMKITGMVATTTAYPQDSFVAAYNPSGISFLDNRIDLGTYWDRTRQKARISGNIVPGVDGTFDGDRTKNFFGLEFGLTRKLPCNITAGVVVYNRNFVKTTYSTNFPLFGTSRLGLEYINQTVAPTIAWQFCDNQSVGLSLNLQYQRFKVDGLETLDNALLTSVAAGFVTNNGYNWSSGVGVTIGWLGKFLCDTVSVGVAYTPETHMSKFRRYRGFYSHGGAFNLPQRVIAGVRYNWIPCSNIALDIEWVNWKQIPSLANGLNVVRGFTEESYRLGGTKGTGFGFKNQIFYRLGADYKWCDFTFRAGFRYAKAPIRRGDTATNILTLDTVEKVVTIGATYDFNRCNEVSFFYAHGFENTIKGRNSIPPGLPPSLGGTGFGGGEADISQSKNVLGIAWGYKY